MKFGKAPATPPALRLASYMPGGNLPTAPAEIGWDHLIGTWNLYCNDRYGCCVFAGAAHEQMLFAKSGKLNVLYTDQNVLDAYTAVTGFNPNIPSTDKGTNVQAAAAYRQQVGIADSTGVRHKIGAAVALEPRRLDQLASAVWIFGAVGIGIEVPDTAQDQFNAGKPWDVVPGSRIEGGHYVSVVGRGNGFWRVVTWGRIQQVTDAFIQTYCDEAWAYWSVDELSNGVNLDNFSLAQFQDDVQLLRAA